MEKRVMVVVEGMVSIILEGCIELFAIASERVEMPE